MQNSEDLNQTGQPADESQWLKFVMIFLIVFLSEALETWLPGFLAAGTSVLIVGLIVFPMRSIRESHRFGGWILRIVLIAVALSLATFVLELFLEPDSRRISEKAYKIEGAGQGKELA